MFVQKDVVSTVLKTTILSTILLTYSFVESTDLVVTRFPTIVSIIHLSLIGWPLLSIVSKQKSVYYKEYVI